MSLALLALAIGLLANISTEYNRLIRFSGDKDRLLSVCGTLELLGRMVEESLEVVEPQPLSSNHPGLEVRTVKLEQQRFQGWQFDPRKPAIRHSVTMVGERLMLKKEDDTPAVLMNDLAGFAASHSSEGVITLQLSLEDRGDVSTYSLRAVRWVR